MTTERLTWGQPLTRRQVITTIVVGAALWFGAAMLLRVLGPMGIYEGTARIWLYILVIPCTLPFVPLTRRLAALAADQVAMGIMFVIMTATLIDGIVLAWLPWIYADTVELVAANGAAILWGAGVGLALGLLLNKPRSVSRPRM